MRSFFVDIAVAVFDVKGRGKKERDERNTEAVDS